ncbi:nuclease/hydrolase [Paraglaciecola Antarctic JLT virus 2]|nr:nuclease/hydrolase [Paraglaciecola Antarctic JLT virus 2]
MISKNHTKTAAEKAWLEMVVEFAILSDWLNNKYGTTVLLAESYEIDHILGAKTKRKINGVSWRVGELAIMPIPYQLHNIMSGHRLNRTTNPGAYRSVFGHEKQVWLDMVRAMQDRGYEIPFSEEIIQSIIK